MKRPNFLPIICTKDAAEVSDSKPIETFVPHQSYSLSEIMQRFERGQRLPARMLFNPESEFTENSLYMEDFEDAPPDDVRDVVDVQNYYEAHQVHKREFAEKKKKGKGKGAPQTEPATEPKPEPPVPEDPAAAE